MSIDIRIAQRCPHLVIEESVPLGDDKRTLMSRAPVASSTLLRVLANDQYYIPSNGLYSQALLVGSKSGPFRIEGCTTEGGIEIASNVFTVSSSTETKTFRLPVGNRVQIADLVRLFKNGLQDIIVNGEDGHLVFADVANIGPRSWIRVSGRGAEAIGFVNQKGSRGQEVYPPWQLDKREDTLPLVNRNGQYITTARYVKFIRPVRGNPDLKVTYTSPPERCPRCGGTFIENDWRFDVPGDVVSIENEDLLYQAAMKILLTRQGSNPYHTAYGTKLMERIGSKAVGAIASLIQDDVRTGLVRVQNLQRQQAQFQKVSLKERLYAILSVEVLPHENDPTTFLVDIVISNGTGEPVRLSIVFAVPGAIALAGTNNLSLGLDTTGLSHEESKRVFR